MDYSRIASLPPFVIFSDVTVGRNITATYLVETSDMGKGSSICQMVPGTREVGCEMRCTAMGNTALKTCALFAFIPNVLGRSVRGVFRTRHPQRAR
jgi:hypothetical protein